MKLAIVLVQCSPNNAYGWSLLCTTALQLSGFAAAVRFGERSVQLNSLDVSAFNNLGVAYRHLGRLDDAERCFLEALRIKADFRPAVTNLGTVYRALGRFSDARRYYEQGLSLGDQDGKLHTNLGELMLAQREYRDALPILEKAVELNPESAVARLNLGIVYYNLSRNADSEFQLRSALSIDSKIEKAFFFLAMLAHDNHKYYKSIEYYQTALQLNPEFYQAYNNLSFVYSELGYFREAIKSSLRAIRLARDRWVCYNQLIFLLNYVPDYSPKRKFLLARLFGKRLSDSTLTRYNSWRLPEINNRLRIGFVSGDLRQHPVGYFIYDLLSALHSREDLEIYVFSASPKKDDLSLAIQSLVAEWVDIFPLSDARGAEEIHARGIQVLIDLSGHTGGNRLPIFARKPAPIQASWLGYFATTGLAEMDYFIGDPFLVDNRTQLNFSERLVQLPSCWFARNPPKVSPSNCKPPVSKVGFITFGALVNIAKINSEVLGTWSKILDGVKNSRLLIQSRQLSDDRVRDDFRMRAIQSGLVPESLILRGHLPMAQYYKTYHEIDICLDTFPYPGGTTSLDAIWMGIPLVSLSGQSFLGNLGRSILVNTFSEEWLAKTKLDYITIALALANNVQYLTASRKKLRERVVSSLIYDIEKFSGQFAELIKKIYNREI